MRDRVEELRKAVEATEQNRRAAMRALAEERQRSLELQVKISRQVTKTPCFSCMLRVAQSGFKSVHPNEIHVIVMYIELNFNLLVFRFYFILPGMEWNVHLYVVDIRCVSNIGDLE